MTAADHATAVQLVRALVADHLTHLDPDERDELVERITGAIDRCARRRAAEELRASAREIWLQRGTLYRSVTWLAARADALDAQ